MKGKHLFKIKEKEALSGTGRIRAGAKRAVNLQHL